MGVGAWACQAAVAGAHKDVLPRCGGRGAAGGGSLVQIFDMYIARTGMFSSVDYPAATASRKETLRWWRCLQPSAELKRLAEMMWCIPASQGASERSWATLSRQSTPIRNSLSPARKSTLLKVCENWRMLLKGDSREEEGDDAPGGKKKRRKCTGLVLHLDARGADHGLGEEDEGGPPPTGSSSSSSSSSSTCSSSPSA